MRKLPFTGWIEALSSRLSARVTEAGFHFQFRFFGEPFALQRLYWKSAQQAIDRLVLAIVATACSTETAVPEKCYPLPPRKLCV